MFPASFMAVKAATFEGSRKLLGRFVLLEHAGFDELVDQLLHRVERGEEALRRHDDAHIALGNGGLAVFFGLKGHEILTHHAAREVDLTDAVRENFSFVRHFQTPYM